MADGDFDTVTTIAAERSDIRIKTFFNKISKWCDKHEIRKTRLQKKRSTVGIA